MANSRLLRVTVDYVFKQIFGDQRYTDVLARFLAAVLSIPFDDLADITIIDPHVKRETADDKYGILDVKLTITDGTVIHIEIQVVPNPDFDKRIIYYQAKLITEQIKSGGDWGQINRAISIIITDYNFIKDSPNYHNQFRFRSQDGTTLSNITEINVLELPKLPHQSDNSELWDWLEFIRTDDEETIEMLETKSPEMARAVGRLKELSADEAERMIAESYENAQRDQASRIKGARSEGERNGLLIAAQKMLAKNYDPIEVADTLGLKLAEVNSLPAS